jgi:hypothetical protein
MMDSRLICFISALFFLVGAVGCGGEEEGGPGAIEGPYAMFFGAQQKVFDLGQVTCRPKPGLSEFEFKAENLGDGDNAINFILQDYTTAKSKWSIEYAIAKPVKNKFDIQLAGGFKYVFFQSINASTSESFNSRCNIDLQSGEAGTQTNFAGTMNCTMLWSDFTSKDYNPGPLNNYIDLLLKFECAY